MALSQALIRQQMGRELRVFQMGVPGSGSTQQTLVDTTPLFKSTIEAGAYTDFTGWWLFRPSEDLEDNRQRRVRHYHAPTGTFLVDRPWTTVPGPTETYELWDAGLTLDQLHECMNQALRKVYVTDRFWLTPPIDQQRSSFLRLPPPLDVQRWLTNAKWITNMGSLPEIPKNPVGMTARVASTANQAYAGLVATFRRERSQGAIRRLYWSYRSATGSNPLTLLEPPIFSEMHHRTAFLLLAVQGGTPAITTPTGYTLVASSGRTGMLLNLYYAPLGPSSYALTVPTITWTGTNLHCYFLEYEGLAAGGFDQMATANGDGPLFSSGTTAALTAGDELCLAALLTTSNEEQYDPSGRFDQINEVITNQNRSLAIYDRNLLLTDLQDRTPSRVEGRVFDPVQDESGRVYLNPLHGITSPGFYLVEARRPLSTMARWDPSGQFGTKLDGFTGVGDGIPMEQCEVEGDPQDGTLDAIVAAAIVYAGERYPDFLKIRDRERTIQQFRMRFNSFNKARQVRPRKQFRYREWVGA